MQITKRRGAAIAVGLLLATTCFAAQPATAQQQGRKVTSQQIKDNTIKLQDLNASVRAKIALGASALQGIADGSISTNKLADNAVTNPKIADDAVSSAEVAADSLTAGDLASNSVTSAELANNSVDTGAVADGSLLAADVAAVRGVTTLDFGNIPSQSCLALQIPTGNVLTNDVIMVTAPPTVPGIISFDGRQAGVDSASISVVACNLAAVALNPAAGSFAWAVLEN